MRVMLRDRNNLPTNVGGQVIFSFIFISFFFCEKLIFFFCFFISQISITIKGCGKISCKLTPSKSLESCIKIIYL